MGPSPEAEECMTHLLLSSAATTAGAPAWIPRNHEGTTNTFVEGVESRIGVTRHVAS
jgi:hypothetical protein